MDQKTLLWTGGGFATGCILSACILKAQMRKSVAGDAPALEAVSSRLRREDITGFSNLTLLLGSPTASGEIDLNEFHVYPAKLNYPILEGNRTLMARYLTPEVYEDLHQLRTSAGSSLDDCIQTGVDNPEKVSCGIVAGDEECYDLFASVFDPIISDRHRGFRRCGRLHDRDISLHGLKAGPFDSKYVKSTHFLVGRCLRGFRFPPLCSRAERNQAEQLLKASLESLEGKNAGTYIHLTALTQETRRSLPDILQSVSDKPNSVTLTSSGSTRDWPSGRGLFFNKSAKFFAWTNREDHLRVMYRDRELDFVQSFRSFTDALSELETNMAERGLDFAFHGDFGYLLTCPSGIGTALRAGVHMKLPYLIRDERFRNILKSFRLHMGAEDQETLRKGYVDVYNMDRLGHTERELVQHVADAVHKLTEMEMLLEKNQSIADILTANDL